MPLNRSAKDDDIPQQVTDKDIKSSSLSSLYRRRRRIQERSRVHAPLKSNLGFMVIVVESSAVRGGILSPTHDSSTPHTSTEMYIPVDMMMTNNG